MLPKIITLPALILATGAALTAPGAYAGSQSDEFWSQFNNTDGGANYSARLPERALVPATPEQAAQLSQFEAQRQITDGGGSFGGTFPDRAKIPATPEQAAQLRQFEAQREITDGAGSYFARADGDTPSAVPARQASSQHSEVVGESMGRP
jgi:hypothetical protein